MGTAATDSTSADRTADETAIRELIHRQKSGWDASDPALYAAVFTCDADYVTFLGGYHRGRDAIAESYVPLFRKLLRGSTLTIDITEIRFVAPDVALIHAEAAVRRPGRPRLSRRTSRINTSVAVRSGDRWMLAASQNTTRRRLAGALLDRLASRG